jgi:hypothetical protein
MPLATGSYNVIFLTDQDIKDNSIIEDNVDPKTIYPIIMLVQDKYLQEITGTELLNALQVNAQAGTLNPNQANLISQYIKKVLIWYTIYENAIYNSLKYTNKGIERMNSLNSVPATLTEIEAIAERAKNNAEFYGQRLIDWLYIHQNDYFPEYNQNQINGADMFPKRETVYQSRLFMGNRKNQNDTNWKDVYYDRGRYFFS